MLLPFISRKKLLKEITKLFDDIHYHMEVWNKSNSPLKEEMIKGLNSEKNALYFVEYYIKHDNHYGTLKSIKDLKEICPHGDNYDDCPDCRH